MVGDLQTWWGWCWAVSPSRLLRADGEWTRVGHNTSVSCLLQVDRLWVVVSGHGWVMTHPCIEVVRWLWVGDEMSNSCLLLVDMSWGPKLGDNVSVSRQGGHG